MLITGFKYYLVEFSNQSLFKFIVKEKNKIYGQKLKMSFDSLGLNVLEPKQTKKSLTPIIDPENRNTSTILVESYTKIATKIKDFYFLP